MGSASLPVCDGLLAHTQQLPKILLRHFKALTIPFKDLSECSHFITLLNSHADATSGRALNVGMTFPAGVLITFRLSFGFVRSTNFFGSIFLGVTIS
jgi:hypothetical protein